jgi:G:T-mismatch repair DNA endonuclease (very short patch repair protein)
VRYWTEKIARNRTRDRLVTGQLRRMDVSVWRMWEHHCTPSGSESLIKRVARIRSRLEQKRSQ